MFISKKIAILSAIFILMVIICYYYAQIVYKTPVQPKIAITQIVQHPSLDLIRKGIIDALKNNGMIANKNYILMDENAQGNIATATLIAQKFAAEKPDVIIAISTPSAQTVYQTVRPLEIPVVFSAVTDPVDAKLVHSLSDNGGNITGTVDMPSSESQIREIVQLIPNLRNMAVIYCPSEINSYQQITALKIAAKKYDIKIVEIAASQTADVNGAAQKAVSQASAIYIPNDNVIISALDSLLQVTDASKIPVFTNNAESVELGSLAAIANDQYEVGRETGRLALEVLKKRNAEHVPVKIIQANKLYINVHKAAQLGIKIPNRKPN